MRPLILWGGNDIHPSIYEEDPHKLAGPYDVGRDVSEIQAVTEAIAAGTPIIGVCRGAQLLCAINGGTLWQHSLGHTNNSHALYGPNGIICDQAAADHHQIMRPIGKYEVLAWGEGPTYVYSASGATHVLASNPEVVWWPDTKCLGIQPHPEWESKNSCFVKWINSVIAEKGIKYAF